jgi:hypothetical protein
MAKTEAKSPRTVGTLSPSPYNPRKITDKQFSMLKKSMAEFGDLSGIVKNIKTGNLVGGHQRIKNLDPSWPIISAPHTDPTGTVALGHIETPSGRWQYREVDWPEKREMAANVAANKHGGYFDMPLLKNIIIEIDDGSFDMDVTGFSNEDLENMLVGEEEWNTAEKTADEVIEAISAKIRKIASDNPVKMNGSMAVVVNNGRGNAVLFLADPNTADIVKELKRLADAGEHSPLETLVRSLL